jgi:tetratricopeptide (TPR) repeat protein
MSLNTVLHKERSMSLNTVLHKERSMSLNIVLTLTAMAFALLLSMEAAAKERSKSDEAARQFFKAGERHYTGGRYEDAAIAFEEAYRLSKRPELLFNLGNTYERMGQYRQAADYLAEFLQRARDMLSPEDFIAVQGRVTRLRQTAAQEEAEAKAELERAAAKVREEVEQRRALEDARRQAEEARRASEQAALRQAAGPQINWPAWVFAAAGAAGAGTAIVFGVLSLNAKSRAAKSCADSGGGVLCQANGADAVSNEQSLAMVTDIALGVGAVGAGLALYFFLTEEDEPTGRQVQLLLGEDTVGLGVVGTF